LLGRIIFHYLIHYLIPQYLFLHSSSQISRERWHQVAYKPMPSMKEGVGSKLPNPFVIFSWRRHPDLNRGITVLQTVALPLGYAAPGAGNGI
jgi:hypothetical protein